VVEEKSREVEGKRAEANGKVDQQSRKGYVVIGSGCN
jgi:hypothetical protein